MAKLEPVYAYVFIEHVDPGAKIRHVLEDFFHQPGVRFVAQVVGSYKAFGAVQAPSIGELHRLVAEEYWNAGIRCKWCVAVVPGPNLPKHGSPDACAVVRIRTDGDAVTVLNDLNGRFEGWTDARHYGSAVVTGEYDILVSIGSDNFDEVIDAIFGQIRTTPGVASTETAFMYLPGNALEREP